MAQYESFNNEVHKLEKLWNNIESNRQDVEELTPINIKEVSLTTLKKTNRFSLDTDPIFYDLYDFKGVTFAGGGSNSPVPTSCYNEDPPGIWHFIFPIFDFRVLAGEDPETVTGCPDWEFQSSIGNINQILRFTQLSEEDIYSFDLLSYLFDADGNAVESDNFSQFYRWIKNGEGYDFHYHAFFTVPQDSQVFLKAELVLVNKRDYNGIQFRKIKN